MTWRTSRYKQMVIDLLKNNDTIVVLDTETVGLKKKCQIVQFSAIRYRYEKNPFSMREVERLDLYIRPDEKLPESATKVNGITNAFLSDYPDERHCFPVIKEFLSKGGILAGYLNATMTGTAMEGTLMYMRWRRTASQETEWKITSC